jgi:hypothetical protein
MMLVIGGPKESKGSDSAFPSKMKKRSMIGGPDEASDDEEPSDEMDADAQKNEALRLMGVPQEKRKVFAKALESFIEACSYEEGNE